MNCPICPDSQLQMSDRQGVEIDYCPKCRGVWLDRGELDKIIDRAATEYSAPPPPPQQQQPQQQQYAPPPQPPPPPYPQQQQQHQQQPGYGNQYPRKPDDSDYKFRYPQQGGHYKKKKKSFLDDIFDF